MMSRQPLLSLVGGFLQLRWVRFGLVGGAATAAYYFLGLLFVSFFSLPLLFGNFVAYSLSFAVSYLGQSKWTFAARSSHAVMLPRFAATQGIGLVINSGIIELCARIGIIYEVSMLIAVAIVPVVVYFICKYWVFPATGQKGS